MEKLLDLDLYDGFIKGIRLYEDKAEVIIEKWNLRVLKLIFNECWCIKDRQSIDQEIGEVTVSYNSELIDELLTDILEGGGTKSEVEKATQVTFYGTFDNNNILEIVSDSVEIGNA